MAIIWAFYRDRGKSLDLVDFPSSGFEIRFEH